MKPLLVIYMMSWAVTDSVNTQLWLYKTCTVNLNYSVDICKNLTAHDDVNNEVQKKVNTYLLYSRYMEIPQSIVSMYLGPLSDRARKPLMLVPFLGHIVSGTLMILNVYFENWDSRFLWLSQSYILFGGYTLLNIAMYGYIGDVTKTNERTMILSILGALGFVMMPLADFCGGQIYKAGGFAPVYFTSLGFIVLGILYITFIPESVTRRRGAEKKRDDNDNLMEIEKKPRRSLFQFIVDTNKLFIVTVKYIFRSAFYIH